MRWSLNSFREQLLFYTEAPLFVNSKNTTDPFLWGFRLQTQGVLVFGGLLLLVSVGDQWSRTVPWTLGRPCFYDPPVSVPVFSLVNMPRSKTPNTVFRRTENPGPETGGTVSSGSQNVSSETELILCRYLTFKVYPEDAIVLFLSLATLRVPVVKVQILDKNFLLCVRKNFIREFV